MTANAVMIEYRFAEFRLDVWQRKLFNAEGETVTLSSRAMDTLLVLLEHRGETLSKSHLMQTVWPNAIVEENNLNQAISSLRKALGDTKNDNNFILTVPLRGYCFVAPVEVLQLPAAGAPAADVQPEKAPEATTVEMPRLVAGTPAKSRLLPLAMLLLLLVVSTSVYMSRDTTAPAQRVPSSPVQTTAGSAQGAFTPTNTAASTIRNSIAVLPFTNLNPDAENELFALGLHDEVINQLTKIRSLNVIARSSVLTFVNQQLSMNDLGKALRVESMMTGTVLFAGEQARISLQMLDANTGITLWAETYEADKQDLAEMISIQSDIAANVAAALKAKIEQSEQEVIAALPTESPKAYRYNIAARIAYYQQNFPKAWELTQQAIELDPGYFNALQTFSMINTVLVSTPLPGMSGRTHFELALESAERMIEIAPGRSEGYANKAVAMGTSKDWESVFALIDKLMVMQAPASDLKHIAVLLLCVGEFDKAIEIYEANLLTEPVNLFSRGFLMAGYELAGNTEKARQEYDLGEELSQVWWGDSVNIFLAMGRNEPLQDVDELVGLSADLKHLLSNLQDSILIKDGLAAYQAKENKVAAEALYYSAIAAYAGDHELAVELLRVALADVWTSLFWLWLPVYDETRQLESFRGLLKDSGIVEFWQQNGWPKVCQPSGDTFVCDWTAYP